VGNVAIVTIVHVLLSLAAMGTGLVLMGGLLQGRAGMRLSVGFLALTAATSATGFLFPIRGFTPAIGVGIVSLVVLAPTALALGWGGLAGGWKSAFVLGAVFLLFLNVFVLVAQLFMKVPVMRELAPTQREAPFVVVQAGLAACFVWLALRAHGAFARAEMVADKGVPVSGTGELMKS